MVLEDRLLKISLGSLASWNLPPGIGLFLASFLSLFLELLLIRWAPSLIRIVAYYGNLMLISSFLGLGCGVLLARRGLGLSRWFPAALLLFVICVSILKGVEFRQGPDELRFLFRFASRTTTLPIILVFLLNTLLFVPLGELIGSYFQQIPPLQAYSWDLGGAISGTAAFGVFSYFWFSPIAGCIIVMVVFLIYCRSRLHFFTAGALFVLSLAIMVFGRDKTAIWSPYNHITVKEVKADGALGSDYTLPRDIATMQDPPVYVVAVNHAFYLSAGTIDSRRYTNPPSSVLWHTEQYSLPHLIKPGAKEALIVGAGAGKDVEAALLAGAGHVDAVEIDPVIIRIGQRYSSSQSYKDPRVSIHNNDARAFFQQTERKYDMVVFGFLDSQGLFNQMSSIRLDGYVYTRESFREAFDLLKPGGVLSISFFSAGKLWLVDRLVAMVRHATDTTPLVYIRRTGQVIILAGKEFPLQGPGHFVNYRRMELRSSDVSEATDDWPYLYLARRFIPFDYLTTIGALLVVSVLIASLGSGRKARVLDAHFFFLGAGFLLLETKSITTISLYFGTTWFVSMVVILGVLTMVLLANLVASLRRKSSLFFYLPLIASVGFLYFFPTQSVLSWPFLARLLYSLIIIPLPIFFAGLIFSSSFNESEDPGLSFGSNLMGAMVGGFVEYLGMITGMRALLLIVLAFYLASVLFRFRIPRGNNMERATGGAR